MNDVYKYLPDEIIPQVSIEYNNGGVETTDVVRVFEVIPGHIYKEYYNSYSGKSFQLYNAEFNFSTVGYSNPVRLTYDDFLKYYPDVIDIRKTPTLGYAADIKRLFKEDLYKPLKRINLANNESQNNLPYKVVLDSMGSDVLFNQDYVDELKLKNKDLENENVKLKLQIQELLNNRFPESLVTDELVDIFSKE